MAEDMLKGEEAVELDDLMEGFNPEGDDVDALIAYLLTGR